MSVCQLASELIQSVPSVLPAESIPEVHVSQGSFPDQHDETILEDEDEEDDRFSMLTELQKHLHEDKQAQPLLQHEEENLSFSSEIPHRESL